MGNEERGVSVDELKDLCRAYIETDQWGRRHVMSMARSQAAKHPALKSTGALRIVRSPHLDQRAHMVDSVVNSFSLAVIRQAVNSK